MTTPETAGEPRGKYDCVVCGQNIPRDVTRLVDPQRHYRCDRQLGRMWVEARQHIDTLTARVREVEAELEHSRMQLVACSMAAAGNFTGCADEYKSVALSDVLALQAQLAAATVVAKIAGDLVDDVDHCMHLPMSKSLGEAHDIRAAYRRSGVEKAVQSYRAALAAAAPTEVRDA